MMIMHCTNYFVKEDTYDDNVDENFDQEDTCYDNADDDFD